MSLAHLRYHETLMLLLVLTFWCFRCKCLLMPCFWYPWVNKYFFASFFSTSPPRFKFPPVNCIGWIDSRGRRSKFRYQPYLNCLLEKRFCGYMGYFQKMWCQDWQWTFHRRIITFISLLSMKVFEKDKFNSSRLWFISMTTVNMVKWYIPKHLER